MKAWRLGISHGYHECGPQLLSRETKRNPYSFLIPRLLVVFTQQLEILVTSLLDIDQVIGRAGSVKKAGYWSSSF